MIKKGVKFALLGLLGLAIMTGVYLWLMFGQLVQGALSVEKLDDGMYYMEYKGDDGFKELMARGLQQHQRAGQLRDGVHVEGLLQDRQR